MDQLTKKYKMPITVLQRTSDGDSIVLKPIKDDGSLKKYFDKTEIVDHEEIIQLAEELLAYVIKISSFDKDKLLNQLQKFPTNDSDSKSMAAVTRFVPPPSV